jgi:hypothetical protein
MQKLHDKSTKIEKQYLATTLEVERVLAELSDRQAEVQTQKDHVDELEKNFILKTTTAAGKAQMRKETAAAKKQFAITQRDFDKMRARAARPQKLKAKLEAARTAAKQAEESFLLQQDGFFVRAPEDAKVAAVEMQVGSKVREKTTALKLADTSAIKVSWKTQDTRLAQLNKGTGVRMLAADGGVVDGQLLISGHEPVTEIPDPDHKLASADKRALRLIRETLDNALVVAAAAKIGEDGALIVEGDQVFRRKVEWIEVRGKDAIARSGLRVGDILVVGPGDATQRLRDHDKVRVSAEETP